MHKNTRNKKFSAISWNAIFLALFFGIISFKTYDLQKINRELEQQKTEYAKKIQIENEKQEELLEEKEYNQSDLYIEKIAREKLGLVKEDEIIFMEKNENDF